MANIKNHITKDIKDIVDNLKSHRLSKGYTQDELAKLAGLDRVAIANIETGKRSPTLKTILKLCHALGVPPKDIF